MMGAKVWTAPGAVISAIVPALALLLAVEFAAPAEVQASDAGVQRLYDDFGRINKQPSGPWYVINWGSEDGQPQRWEGVPCGSDSCVRARKSGDVSYADLSIHPSDHPGFFTNAELAEQNTGFAAGQPGAWKPAPGHPVELEARVRWSPNHRADGSGGAQGSSGIWFWNSPIDVASYPDSQFGNLKAFGISWTAEDSATLNGLNASVVVPTEFGPYPVWSAAPDRPVDLQRWNEISIRWMEDGNGQQAVRFWINGRYLGMSQLAEPFDPLSLEIWSDNQVPTPNGVEYRNPTSEQSLQVDYIDVSR